MTFLCLSEAQALKRLLSRDPGPLVGSRGLCLAPMNTFCHPALTYSSRLNLIDVMLVAVLDNIVSLQCQSIMVDRGVLNGHKFVCLFTRWLDGGHRLADIGTRCPWWGQQTLVGTTLVGPDPGGDNPSWPEGQPSIPPPSLNVGRAHMVPAWVPAWSHTSLPCAVSSTNPWIPFTAWQSIGIHLIHRKQCLATLREYPARGATPHPGPQAHNTHPR